MIKNNFALGTWQIHLQTKNQRELISNKMNSICSYIDTAINYNNDYLLTNITNYKIISKIAPCHYPYYDLFIDNHLKCLKHDIIDIMLIHSSRGNWQDLAVRLEKDNRFKQIGISNFNIDQIIEYKNLIGHFPKYNQIQINPYYTDIETINFCKANNIKIIAYGIFGGKYRSQRYIADFSIPYLISYVNQYADIIILKPECERQVNEIIDVIKNYQFNNEFELKLNNILDDKSVIPMKYLVPEIQKKCLSVPTYNNSCGRNKSKKQLRQQLLLQKPNFEMLGDYMTFLRYCYKKNYNNIDNVYFYDLLIGDNGYYYAAYLYDKNGKLSKINQTNIIELVQIKEI